MTMRWNKTRDGLGGLLKCVVGLLLLAAGLPAAHAYYDPAPQRWINRDPLADRGSLVFALNGIDDQKREIASRQQIADIYGGRLFGFVSNEPLTRFDPWGLTPKPGDIKWCSKALKLLKEYERIAKKKGLCISPKRVAELNRKRDGGTITSDDLPATIKSEFPGCFEGMTLSDIEDFCP